jgi:UPF0755 protein
VLKKMIVFLVVLGVLLGAAGGLWLWQGLDTLDQPITLVEPEIVTVEQGTAFAQFARRMEQEGYVEDDLWVRLFGLLNPDQTLILAGDYEVTPGMTPRTLLKNVADGKVKFWSVQFIEGWTFKDVRAALARSEPLKKVTTDWSAGQIMEAIGAAGKHPEGWFFPDTYRFNSNETDLDILRRAHDLMTQVLAEEWQNRAENLPYDSPYEALIMASIVERETGVPHERDQVAGVFVRRLEKGMRLQTDPTVIYGMGDAYQGQITRRDLQTYTPYNTYRIDGLPPTPIAMPGREAIHASLHPAEGDTYYFVARGDGSHKFSRTLEAHNEAVRKYQLNRREDYRSYRAPSAVEEREGGD